jgi:maltose alpha-D-glucosyltransferase/alpha-amylase
MGAFATAPAGSRRTRVHGDYHLGQVLAVGQDFVLIDFEGEPARPLAERRAKQSPLKDVAGMLRSFSYAAHAALLAASEERPDRRGELESRAQIWDASVRAAFLERYRRTTVDTSLVPSDDRGFERLLDAFVLEKALYEVGYELASRPQWVGIPLLGILQILRAQETPADGR